MDFNEVIHKAIIAAMVGGSFAIISGIIKKIKNYFTKDKEKSYSDSKVYTNTNKNYIDNNDNKEIIVEKGQSISIENIFCRKCGAKLDANSKFCNKCGTEVIRMEEKK